MDDQFGQAENGDIIHINQANYTTRTSVHNSVHGTYRVKNDLTGNSQGCLKWHTTGVQDLNVCVHTIQLSIPLAFNKSSNKLNI